MKKHDPVSWIQSNFDIKPSNAAEFIYAGMASQSNFHWPFLDVPFDPNNPIHFKSRAGLLDYVSVIGRGRILDFGIGDGGYILPIASMFDSLVGIDGSEKQIGNCKRNAEKLNVTNGNFVHVPPGEPLPFSDNYFDGATTAKAIEFVPNLQASLKEMARVLRPGARFRIVNEPLTIYANGSENEIWTTEDEGGASTRMTIFKRDINAGRTNNYGLLLSCPFHEVERVFKNNSTDLTYACLYDSVLDELRPQIIQAVHWVTTHPSVAKWRSMLSEAGFSRTDITYSADWVAVNIFDKMTKHDFSSVESLDNYLRPIVEVVAQMKSAPEDGFHVGTVSHSERLGPAFQMTRITATK